MDARHGRAGRCLACLIGGYKAGSEKWQPAELDAFVVRELGLRPPMRSYSPATRIHHAEDLLEVYASQGVRLVGLSRAIHATDWTCSLDGVLGHGRTMARAICIAVGLHSLRRRLNEAELATLRGGNGQDLQD